MSPKSKGRPKGRGRTPSRRPHQPRELTPLDRLLRDARTLEVGTLDPVDVRLIASSWLGEAWGSRGMGDRDAEGALVASLVREAGRSGKRTAYLALAALRTIAHGDWRDDVATALAAAPADHPLPAWATTAATADEKPPVPERAQVWADPWGSESLYLLRYAVPSPHVVLVPRSTVGGTMIQSLMVDGDADPDDVIGNLSLRGDVEATDALADVADGLWKTDMYWPPQDDPDYVVNRAYVHWLTDGHRREADWEDFPDEDRRELLDAFQRDHGASLDLDATTVELLADTFIDFGVGYLSDGVLAWSPGEVERFLLDWAQRKVLLDPDDIAALPEVLREWVVFALRRKGLAEADIAPVVDAVDEVAADYLRDAGTAPKGPAAQLLARAMAEGVDLADQEAVGRLIGAYNAERNARRLLDS